MTPTAVPTGPQPSIGCGAGPSAGCGAGPSAHAILPGLAATAAATGFAFLLAQLAASLSATSVAVVLGAVMVNAGLVRPSWHDGIAFATKSLLRVAVVLLGLQLSLEDLRRLGLPGGVVVATTVTVTFLGTRLLARLIGVPRPLGLLIATGFSICGASAVAGMEPVAGGDEDDTVVAVALVTLCGSLAIVVLPLLRVPLDLDYLSFGSWAGASVHDVGQTVATANRVGHGALEPAVVVKLTRVLLLAPLVAGVSLARRYGNGGRQAGHGAAGHEAAGHEAAGHGAAGHGAAAHKGGRDAARAGRRPAFVPLFVVGFVASVALRSSGAVPPGGLRIAQDLQQVLLTAALFGLGAGVSWRLLRRAGGRPLLLGLVSWLLIGAVAYVGVRLTDG